MKVHWGWLTAAIAAIVITVLVAGFRRGSCDGPLDTCQSEPVGGLVGMIVLVAAGLALTTFCSRQALRRR